MATPPSPYDVFIKSTQIGYEQWHDGIGYDLDAFRALSPKDQDRAIQHLMGHKLEWRDIEVFQVAATSKAIEALKECLNSSESDTRLCAANALREMGHFQEMDHTLVRELNHAVIGDGLSRIIDMIDRPASPAIIDTLLQGVQDRPPEVAVHYAALICYLVGKTEDRFDWDMRPFFLQFAEGTPAQERQEAYAKLCQIAGRTPPTS